MDKRHCGTLVYCKTCSTMEGKKMLTEMLKPMNKLTVNHVVDWQGLRLARIAKQERLHKGIKKACLQRLQSRRKMEITSAKW